jgi:DNA polymerase kappa
MLAKICSEKNKPNGQFFLSGEKETVMNFMKELDVRKIPGIGNVSEQLLKGLGINTCGDILE